MASLVFDFDSTLFPGESLEEILERSRSTGQNVLNKIRHITKMGMEGEISFRDSLEQRLHLAAPHLTDVRRFGEEATGRLTQGMRELIEFLQAGGHTIIILSGGLREAIEPLGRTLGLPPENVLAVALRWTDDGRFLALDPDDLLSTSKVDGARAAASNWPRPVIAIGDGMTDYALHESGIADHFIAFTQHVARPAVLQKARFQADSTQQLSILLEQLL